MAAAAAARSSPAGRLCTSPSTITPASPSPACCPTSKPKPPSPSCAPPSPSTPSTASPSAACSPTTAPAIALDTSAPPASNSASSTASPVLTLPAPTARRNASSKPLCASGPTFANYLNSEERDQHLSPWLEHYNFHRPHASLGYAPPISRAIPPGTTC